MKLINANALKEWIENWFAKAVFYHPYNKSNNISIPELYDILERMPTVDAIPIEWLKRYEIIEGQEVRLQDAINEWEKENEHKESD